AVEPRLAANANAAPTISTLITTVVASLLTDVAVVGLRLVERLSFGIVFLRSQWFKVVARFASGPVAASSTSGARYLDDRSPLLPPRSEASIEVGYVAVAELLQRLCR